MYKLTLDLGYAISQFRGKSSKGFNAMGLEKLYLVALTQLRNMHQRYYARIRFVKFSHIPELRREEYIKAMISHYFNERLSRFKLEIYNTIKSKLPTNYRLPFLHRRYYSNVILDDFFVEDEE